MDAAEPVVLMAILLHHHHAPLNRVPAVQVPDRNFFLIAADDADRNEWVAAIGEHMAHIVMDSPFVSQDQSIFDSTASSGRATTESRRVRSYSEEVLHRQPGDTLVPPVHSCRMSDLPCVHPCSRGDHDAHS